MVEVLVSGLSLVTVTTGNTTLLPVAFPDGGRFANDGNGFELGVTFDAGSEFARGESWVNSVTVIRGELDVTSGTSTTFRPHFSQNGSSSVATVPHEIHSRLTDRVTVTDCCVGVASSDLSLLSGRGLLLLFGVEGVLPLLDVRTGVLLLIPACLLLPALEVSELIVVVTLVVVVATEADCACVVVLVLLTGAGELGIEDCGVAAPFAPGIFAIS